MDIIVALVNDEPSLVVDASAIYDFFFLAPILPTTALKADIDFPLRSRRRIVSASFDNMSPLDHCWKDHTIRYGDREQSVRSR